MNTVRVEGGGVRKARVRLAAVAAACALVSAAGVESADAASAPAPPKGWVAGWIVPNAKFVGRYRLTASRIVNPGVRGSKTTGELTLFLQTTYAGSPPVPAGIISLHTADTTDVLYLTELDHTGTTLESLVHGGSFVAPATGRFVVSKLAGGEIRGTLTGTRLAKRELTFKRFSKRTQ
jgi:hypothetical protein